MRSAILPIYDDVVMLFCCVYAYCCNMIMLLTLLMLGCYGRCCCCYILKTNKMFYNVLDHVLLPVIEPSRVGQPSCHLLQAFLNNRHMQPIVAFIVCFSFISFFFFRWTDAIKMIALWQSSRQPTNEQTIQQMQQSV